MWLRLTASVGFFQRKKKNPFWASYEGCLKDESQNRYFSVIN